MDFSASLMAKLAVGTTAATAATLAGIYKDDIASLFGGENADRKSEGDVANPIPSNNNLTPLGLPEGCELKEGESEKDCGDLTADDLKKIKFDGWGENFTASIANNGKVKLKIKKVVEGEDNDKKVFPDGKKIIFENSEEVTFSGESITGSAKWEKNTNPEYKEENKKLKKAWNAIKLIEATNLKCPGSNNECEIKNSWIKINGVSGAYNNGKFSQLFLQNNSGRKFVFSENQANYNQGVKLTVKDSKITLKAGAAGSSLVTLTSDMDFEVKFTCGNWCLSKKP